VLVNLINNAVQALASVEGPRNVLIRAEPAGAKSVRLYVDDSGPGIPEPLRPSIFDPYVTHTAGGTGLGLAIVKKIVVEHGGTIEVGESPLGGARMAITLPLAALPEPDVAGAPRPAAGQPQIDAA
jgi:signal transduction histidine kinase